MPYLTESVTPDTIIRDHIYSLMAVNGKQLASFPHLANGLATDEAKADPVYRGACINAQRLFAELRKVNARIVKARKAK